MDPETHRRFLDYLELRRYFARDSDLPKLAPAEFTELDVELGRLLVKEREGASEPADVRRIVELRRVLFRD